MFRSKTVIYKGEDAALSKYHYGCSFAEFIPVLERPIAEEADRRSQITMKAALSRDRAPERPGADETER